ncbi:MAG: hypothetical protein ABI747_01210 [Candidatus Moraniibacteriota bacterium]
MNRPFRGFKNALAILGLIGSLLLGFMAFQSSLDESESDFIPSRTTFFGLKIEMIHAAALREDELYHLEARQSGVGIRLGSTILAHPPRN